MLGKYSSRKSDGQNRVKWPSLLVGLRSKTIFGVYSWQLATLLLRSRPH